MLQPKIAKKMIPNDITIPLPIICQTSCDGLNCHAFSVPSFGPFADPATLLRQYRFQPFGLPCVSVGSLSNPDTSDRHCDSLRSGQDSPCRAKDYRQTTYRLSKTTVSHFLSYRHTDFHTALTSLSCKGGSQASSLHRSISSKMNSRFHPFCRRLPPSDSRLTFLHPLGMSG